MISKQLAQLLQLVSLFFVLYIRERVDYSKQVRVHVIRIRLKIEKKLIVFRHFQQCENQHFSSVFRVQLKMHVRCDNQQKSGAGGGWGRTILGQPMLFEGMGICVLSPAHECEMRGSLVYMLIVKYLPILFKFSHSILDWTALPWNFLGNFFFMGLPISFIGIIW